MRSEADICQLGMDQRKVNVLAREYCDDIKRKNKPIILSHHMLPGLQQGQEKMSKSDPSSSIYMEDEEAEVNVKIKKAYCPPNIVNGNPCLEYVKFIIFPSFGKFEVERREDNGGNKTFTSFEELVVDYEEEKLHPADLKPALSKALNKILQPVRDHFKNDPKAKDLLKKVKSSYLISSFLGLQMPSSARLQAPFDGSGDLGTVYLAELTGTNCLFAVKIMDNESLGSRKKMPRALTERDILQVLDHPFLPTLFAYFTTNKFSILDLGHGVLPRGDLHILRQQQPRSIFTEQAASSRFYVAEVLLALETYTCLE
ncbi:hypothetical protein IFM89_011251 [Coptis chinensis]|uniref:tyrosine--tRNA ligase n=1 Tax=Coptis chinensis TaxID=261450 RepID=A0A835LM33_9MAGN|nr:hypothetical protein IFM89_011251 [Coptis chinensis]